MEETVSTLDYAIHAKSIRDKPELNRGSRQRTIRRGVRPQGQSKSLPAKSQVVENCAAASLAVSRRDALHSRSDDSPPVLPF